MDRLLATCAAVKSPLLSSQKLRLKGDGRHINYDLTLSLLQELQLAFMPEEVEDVDDETRNPQPMLKQSF